MYSKKQILLFFIALLWLTIAFAQDPQPTWRNYNTDHGLASSEMYVAMQDSKGYMWFGTDNGLSRFDGYNFQNYGPVDGLQDNVVFDLQEDQQGRIWIMTMSGNAYYHEQDSIYPFQYNDTIQLFINQFSMGVHLYFDDMDSSLYVTLRNLGILQIKADGAYHLYRGEKPDALVVLELKEKLLYAYSFFDPWVRDAYNRQLEKNQLCTPLEFHGDTINTLTPEGCIISSTANEGKIKKFQNGSYLVNYVYNFGLIKNQKVQWIRAATTPVKSVFEDKEGAIFLCQATGSGAARFENLEMLKKGLSQIYLPGISAVNMAQDKENGYWFTTTDKGIYYAPGLQFQIYDETSGLSNAYISSFEEKDDSTIFVGLWNEDIFELNTRTHHLKKLKSKNQRPKDGGIKDLFYDEKRKILWSGNFLSHFNGKNWKQIEYVDSFTYTTQHFFQVGKFINSKANSQLLVSSWNNIGKLDLPSKSFHSLLYDSINISYRLFSGFEDINRQLWLGRMNGLWRLQGDTIPMRPEIMHPSFYNRIEAISQLPDSTFVIGTKGRGIILWKDTSFTEITATDGLTSNMIENIYVDKKGVIWVGTLMGLNKVIRQPDNTFSIEKITLHHGLPSNEINKVEVINNEVWVATTKGLVRFPYEHQLSLVSDPPFFEKVLINDKAIDWENTKLTFSHQQNNISFQFLTINYRLNGQIPYRYRLAPSQEDWKATNNRKINFPALDNGAYRFEVQSQNEDGIWSDSTTYDFKILPPWWETWWAISLVILAAAAVGFGIYKNRTRQLKKEIRLHQDMAEVERQALRSQMNPHFIFNALNAIQGYIAQGDKLAANRYLSRFSKLIRSALQHSRVTKIPLEDDLNSLKNYIELEQLRFKGGFDYQINIADEIDPTEVTIPPMLVQPFVENAIIHGFTNLEGKGKINIDFYKKNGFLLITIRDNGIGIEASKKQIKSITSSHKSVGITITKRRLEMLSGNGEIGNVHTKELKDEYGQVIGTSVSLRIPLEE